jgi:hypothetical protein
MSLIQISTNIGNRALGCSTTQANLTWALAHNPLPNGALPNAVRIDNTSNSTGVYVKIATAAGTITVPGSSTDGNCFFIAPFDNTTVQLIPAGGNVATSAFNDGSGNCVISGITTDGTAIITVTPVGV